MKLIKGVNPPCPCMIKLAEYRMAQVDEDGNSILGPGTIVECDCGIQYVLESTLYNGMFWRRYKATGKPRVILPTDPS